MENKNYPLDAVMEFLRHHQGKDRALLYAAGDENGGTFLGIGDVDTTRILLFMLIRKTAEKSGMSFVEMMQHMINMQEVVETLEKDGETGAEE